MVSYSFRPRFVDPILSGRKRQTVRAHRRRHARAGEELQLYTGMRTRSCRLIGRSICVVAAEVTLRFRRSDEGASFRGAIDVVMVPPDLFAQQDGFANWAELKAFWEIEHPADFQAGRFEGVMICWGDLIDG